MLKCAYMNENMLYFVLNINNMIQYYKIKIK